MFGPPTDYKYRTQRMTFRKPTPPLPPNSKILSHKLYLTIHILTAIKERIEQLILKSIQIGEIDTQERGDRIIGPVFQRCKV